MGKMLCRVTLTWALITAPAVFAQNAPPPNGPNPDAPGRADNMMPGAHRHHPPPAAVAACADKAADMACAFVTPRGDTLSGMCRQIPSGVLACVPHHPHPPGGPGSGNPGDMQ